MNRPILKAFLVSTFSLNGLSFVGAVPLISEIRMDRTGETPDNAIHYFELRGIPGESLDGLSYVVLGDRPGHGSGVIEEKVDLSDLVIPEDEYFLAAEFAASIDDVLPNVVPDLPVRLNFENRDNVTYLLVSSFGGTLNQDLDPGDSGVLATDAPLGTVLDAVALIEVVFPVTAFEEFEYATSLGFAALGPDGSDPPAHVYRNELKSDKWGIGTFNMNSPDACDTPGTRNVGLTCDFDSDNSCNLVDLNVLYREGNGRLVEGVELPTASRFDFNRDHRLDNKDISRWLAMSADARATQRPIAGVIRTG